MKKILIVYCSMTGNTRAAAEAIAAGVTAAGGQAVLKESAEAEAGDLIGCDAVALGSYDAFSYMGGGIKAFFDRSFYPARDQVAGKPYAAFMTHGSGGRGIASLEAVAQAFRLKPVAKPVTTVGRPDPQATAEFERLGAALVKAEA